MYKSAVRKTLLFLMAAVLLVTSAACSKDEDIPGLLTQETGSIADYQGWWLLTDDSEDAPFFFLLIDANNPHLHAYSEAGEFVGTGNISYSEQRALNGNDLMVFQFSDTQEYGASSYRTETNRYITIRDRDEAKWTFQRDDTDMLDTVFARDYSFTIHNETEFPIKSIRLEPTGGSAVGDPELLSVSLSAGQSIEISGTVSGRLAAIEQWLLEVTDVDDDTNIDFDVFRLFEAESVTIHWGEEDAGYYCTAQYGENAAGSGGQGISFTFYNRFNRDITELVMIPAGASAGEGISLLSATLGPGQSVTVSGDTIPAEMASVTQWTLQITDSDGDTATSDVFDPSAITYVDVDWGMMGYVYQFGDTNPYSAALQPGRWVQYGVSGGDVLEITEDGTVSISSSAGEVWHTDNIMLSTREDIFFRELNANYIWVDMDFSGSAIPIYGQVSPDLKALVVFSSEFLGGMDVRYTSTVYIHESTAQTAEAHDIVQRAKLFGYSWQAEDGANVIFAADGNLITGTGSIGDSAIEFGKWEYAGGVLSIRWEGEFGDQYDIDYWDRPVTEECTVDEVDKGFTIPSVGRITGSDSEVN